MFQKLTEPKSKIQFQKKRLVALSQFSSTFACIYPSFTPIHNYWKREETASQISSFSSAQNLGEMGKSLLLKLG